MERWSTGDPIVLREIWRGRVFEARPATVVEDAPEQTTLVIPGGVRCGVPIGEDGAELRLPDRPWRLEVRQRGPEPILSFAWPETPYAVLRWTTEEGTPVWYVNLQRPLERTELGFDTADHALDVIVELDGSWAWKDEDELAEAVEHGLFTIEETERFRAEGERAVARILDREPPFDHDWSPWRPDPSWATPMLPDGWDRV
ncbi:MAG TPA: DUF402 domain-containing protein [Actinomycetota bacterium]|nr:DUF402 domain-containing protein [Actinomycetota bacterium]